MQLQWRVDALVSTRRRRWGGGVTDSYSFSDGCWDWDVLVNTRRRRGGEDHRQLQLQWRVLGLRCAGQSRSKGKQLSNLGISGYLALVKCPFDERSGGYFFNDYFYFEADRYVYYIKIWILCLKSGIFLEYQFSLSLQFQRVCWVLHYGHIFYIHNSVFTRAKYENCQ